MGLTTPAAGMEDKRLDNGTDDPNPSLFMLWHLWPSLSLFFFHPLRILGILAALPTSQDELYFKLREIMSVKLYTKIKDY